MVIWIKVIGEELSSLVTIYYKYIEMSSTVSGYGSINAKTINLESEIVYHGSTDDTKKFKLRSKIKNS